MTSPGPTQLLGPAEIRDLADLLGIQPTKKLGQNFVIDANTVRLEAAGIAPTARGEELTVAQYLAIARA